MNPVGNNANEDIRPKAAILVIKSTRAFGSNWREMEMGAGMNPRQLPFTGTRVEAVGP